MSQPSDEMHPEDALAAMNYGLRAHTARIAELEREVETLRKDRERLDWLEGELDRERDAILDSRPIPHSLFRSNMAITRNRIDAARAQQAEQERDDPDDAAKG